MVKVWLTILGLGLVFAVRFYFSTLSFNPDIWNHQAWIESVETNGWRGIYERQMEPRAAVNYPPLALYSFILTEKAYQQLPESWQNENLRAAFYKLPSLFADVIIGYLLGAYLSWGVAWIYWLNPTLWYNSVVWGQIESLSALTGILAILAVTKRKVGWTIIMSAVAILTKQNVLPILPIVAWELWKLNPKLTKIMAVIGLAWGMVLLAYSPMIPAGVNPGQYIVNNFLGSIGGQSHQQLASVNAWNGWYMLGMNNMPDQNWRWLALALSLFGVRLAIKSRSVWPAVVIISLWTFMFMTRMHERHSFMTIAYLTWIYPQLHNKWAYWGLSMVSWLNVWGVWQGYFWQPLPNDWDQMGKWMSGFVVFAGLVLIVEMLYQDGVKAKIVNGGQTKNTRVAGTPLGS